MSDKTLDVILAEKVIEHGFSATRTRDINKARQALKVFVTLARPTISSEQYTELSRLTYSTESDGIFGFFKRMFTKKQEVEETSPVIKFSDGMTSALKTAEAALKSLDNGTLRVKVEPIHVPNYEFSLIPGDTDGRDMVRTVTAWNKKYAKVTALWKEFEKYFKSVVDQLGVSYTNGDEEKEKEIIVKLLGNKKVIGLFDELADVLDIDVPRNHKWVPLDGVLVLDNHENSDGVLGAYYSSFNRWYLDRYTPSKLTTESFIEPFQEKDIRYILNEISDILKDHIDERFDKIEGYDLEYEDTPFRDDDDYRDFIIFNAGFILSLLDRHTCFGNALKYTDFREDILHFIEPYFNAALLSLEPVQE